MALVKFVEEQDADPRIKAVYAEIKQAFGLDFVPNIFKAMANSPEYLELNWARHKAIMQSGKLERQTKEIIAVAVSAVNNCEYCVNAHTATLKKMGLGDAEITEVMAVVDLYSGFNKFLDGTRVESDLKP